LPNERREACWNPGSKDGQYVVFLEEQSSQYPLIFDINSKKQNRNEKGKLVERQGRKAMGLTSFLYGCQVAILLFERTWLIQKGEVLMKRVKKVLMLTVIACMLQGTGLAAAYQKTEAAEMKAGHSTWLWETNTIVRNGDKLLAFMEQNDVAHIFLQINKNIPRQTYQDFIKKAGRKGMAVYALDGAPNWVSNQGQKSARSFVSWVANYQAQVSEGEKFAGIHLDVEPYLYEGWNSQYAKTILAYQSLLVNAKASSEALHLPLTADIPFWFDEKSYNNRYGKGKLSDWVIANTDSVTIMAYRDGAEGANGIIELVKNEMNYAALQNKNVTIGVETVQSLEGDFVSFHEEGSSYMMDQLEIVQSSYQNVSSFHGFAIHSIHGWMAMK
jgi:hypothetical protein